MWLSVSPTLLCVAADRAAGCSSNSDGGGSADDVQGLWPASISGRGKLLESRFLDAPALSGGCSTSPAVCPATMHTVLWCLHFQRHARIQDTGTCKDVSCEHIPMLQLHMDVQRHGCAKLHHVKATRYPLQLESCACRLQCAGMFANQTPKFPSNTKIWITRDFSIC